MTAEKHPLETVREKLKNVSNYALPRLVDECLNDAIRILTTYMGQPQSCAECERLGMDDTKPAIALTYAIEAMKGKSNDR